MNRRFRDRITSLLAAIAIFPGTTTLAQTTAAQPGQPTAAAQMPDADRLTPSELEDLLGGIALYPDPLLANVLAAAVYPDEVAAAAAFIAGGGKADQVDAKPWEAPVKAIAKIPDAIKMMGQYKEWTVALGQAYLIQAKDVMDVVQTLRKQAQKSGALQTSPQQIVVVEKEVIYIKPSDPEIIYVPTYSPSVVYVEKDDNDAAVAGIVGFGLGVATGLILANNLDCDYHSGCVGYGHHGGNYNSGNYRGGNNTININGDVNIGNTNTNISGNNVGNTANVGNRVGNEGNAYAPNKSKTLATAQPTQLNQFKTTATGANRAAVPGGTRTRTASAQNRSAAAAGQAGARPAGQPAARPTEQPARPGAEPNARPTGGAGEARAAAPSASPRVPQAPPRQPSPGAFSGGRDTQAASQRGAASRAESGGAAARSAPARSSGGDAPSRSAARRR